MPAPNSSYELALELALREMELVAAGVSQSRAALAAILGFVLTIDTLFFAEALERGVKGGELALGVAALVILIVSGAWGLLPHKGIVVWPDYKTLIDGEVGSLSDARRKLTIAYVATVASSQNSLRKLTITLGLAIAVSVGTVGLWAWIVSDLPPALT